MLAGSCPHVPALLHAHVQALHLRIVSYNNQAVTVQSLHPDFPPTLCKLKSLTFQLHIQGDRALHLLRMRARRIALASVPATRLDRQGIEMIDLEAASSPRFKRFLDSLSYTEALRLAVYRCGAVRSPTQRYQGAASRCSFCQAPFASARHLFADCPQFNSDRFQLERAYQVPSKWGVVVAAAPTPSRGSADSLHLASWQSPLPQTLPLRKFGFWPFP